MSRIVCQFSCGAASAVATKLALAQYGATHEVQIVNAFVQEEHPDNRRFLLDCEKWFGRPITVLRDERYGASVIEVFRRERFMKSRFGAPCTAKLKRKLLDQWRQPEDVMVFGYTAEEGDRFEDFKDRNPDKKVIAPLIERELGKKDCLAMLERAGIEMPAMYRLGYSNANCIGCIKGGEGYFRAIREDFPTEFETLCKTQEAIGPGAYLFRNRATGERYSLRDIPPRKGAPRPVAASLRPAMRDRRTGIQRMTDPIQDHTARVLAFAASQAAQAETKRHNEAATQRQREAAAIGAGLDPDALEQGEPA